MNNEEWKQAESALKSMYTTVRLRCDEYELSLRLERINTYKLAIVFYINGVFKGKWLMEDCEERRRFFNPVEKSVLTAKGKKAYAKLSKKEQQEWHEKFFYISYTAYWTSFRKLKKHLTENNKSIELIEIK